MFSGKVDWEEVYRQNLDQGPCLGERSFFPQAYISRTAFAVNADLWSFRLWISPGVGQNVAYSARPTSCSVAFVQ